MLFPDYSHAIASGSSNTYTATQDCFYFCLVNSSNNSASISVNGTKLGSYAYDRFFVSLYLRKNDKVTGDITRYTVFSLVEGGGGVTKNLFLKLATLLFGELQHDQRQIIIDDKQKRKENFLNSVRSGWLENLSDFCTKSENAREKGNSTRRAYSFRKCSTRGYFRFDLGFLSQSVPRSHYGSFCHNRWNNGLYFTRRYKWHNTTKKSFDSNYWISCSCSNNIKLNNSSVFLFKETAYA